MFRNTGDFSTYFLLAFLLISFLGMLGLGFLLWRDRKSEQQVKLDKLIEIAKWYIVSVGIVVSATIVSNAFKEREQDVKEIEVFDKYVSTILAADGIEKRWLLADYFSIVAPSGELRTSWGNYRSHIEPDLLAFRTNKEKLAQLAAKDEPTENDRQEIGILQSQTAPLKESLTAKKSETEWVIIVGTDVSLSEAKFELQKALSASKAARIYKAGTQFRTVIPGFASRDDAVRALPNAQQLVNTTSYILELKTWCSSPRDTGEYVECQ